MQDRNHRFNCLRRRIRQRKSSTKKNWKDKRKKWKSVKKNKSRPDSFLKILQ